MPSRPSRATSAWILGLLLAAGCSELDIASGLRRRGSGASGSSADVTADDEAARAKALFDALEPRLAQNCGGACHADGEAGAPVWLGRTDPYGTIKAYEGIVVIDPRASILLTKTAHEGPGLPAALVPDVTRWLEAEKSSLLSASDVITTASLAIPNGDGGFDLPPPGGRVTFTASLAGGVLTLKNVKLVAPANTGVHLAGVHLDVLHVDGTSTRNESFAEADSTAPKGLTVDLGVSLVVVPRVANDDRLQLAIEKLETSDALPAPASRGACKSVTSFQTNAVPAIQQGTCMNCHDAGGTGNAALDLSGLAADPPDFARACGQAKSRIDTTNVEQSPIILAPSGGVATHPYRNANGQYRTQMTTWINAEK